MENEPNVAEIVETLPIFERSILTQQLINRLQEMEIEEIITYNEMSEILTIDVRSPKGRGYLHTAREKVLEFNHMVFETIRNVGLKRLSDEDIVKLIPARHLSLVRKSSRKVVKKVQSVDYDNLTAEGKVKHNASMTIASMFHQITEHRFQKSLEGKVTNTQRELENKEVLRLLTKLGAG